MFNKIKEIFALYLGKLSVFPLKLFNHGATAFPGKLALKIDNSFLRLINERCEKIILIIGTNGKTTTNNLINHLLNDFIVLSNLKGANMSNGLASTYIKDTKEHYDYGIFEVDEGSLDFVTKYLKPDYILLTNFFRDQLDRYGEIEWIVNEVMEDIRQLPQTNLVMNIDDPLVNQFKQKLNNNVITYGSDLPSNEILETNLLLKKCPICGEKITYDKYYYGHLGDYHCTVCGFSNEDKDYIITDVKEFENYQQIEINNDTNIYFPYIGLYNAYNVCGVYSLLNQLDIAHEKIIKKIQSFSFSLGRMEDFTYKNKTLKVILTKNPIGLSQATKIISDDHRTKTIIHILNDKDADGKDISWIWDANTLCENEETIKNYYCSGIRAEEIALKKKYDDINLDKININNNLYKTIDTAIQDDVEIVYILPTYTAVFETRDYVSKITGKED